MPRRPNRPPNRSRSPRRKRKARLSITLDLDRQNRFRQRYARSHPDWRPSGQVFETLVRRYVCPDTRVLDLGCGRGGLLELLYREVALATGVDPDYPSLAQYRQPAVHRAAGVAGRLPFPDSCFDLVLCAWVFEHLNEPWRAFEEVARVLRPPDLARDTDGGHLIFLTPNSRHPLIRVNRLLGWVGVQQGRLVKRLYDRAEADTFPAVYRANTPRQVEQLAAAAGLIPVAFYTVSDPTYLAFNEVLYRTAVLLERMIPAGSKIHLVGDFVYDPS